VKVAVISDTHLPRFAARLEDALARVAGEHPNLILHCGDLTTLAATAAFEGIAPVEAVAGNNDGPEIVRRYGRRKVVTAGSLRIGMVHGDGARGTTLERARTEFAGEPLDVIAFGHSHVPYLGRHAGVWLVNPGSVTDKRRQPRYSFAVLEADATGTLVPRLVYYDASPPGADAL
jgi:putative phosphoesterase